MQSCQTPQPQYSDGQDILSGKGTCEPELAAPQPGGNQAALEEAGLNPAWDEDGGLAECLEDFAPVVLGAMPFPLAIRTAIPFLHLGGVRAWVDQFTLAEVAAGVRGVVADLIDTLWPVGVGFQFDANLAGALGLGVGVEGQTHMKRTGGDEATPSFSSSLSVSETIGGDLTVPMGLGKVDTGVGLTIQVGADGSCKTAFDIVDMLAASLLTSASPLSMLLAGGAARLDPTGNIAALLPWEPGAWETALRLKATTEAKGGLQLDLGQMVESPLYGPVAAALGAARGEKGETALAGAKGLASAAAGAGLTLELGTKGALVEGALTTKAMGSLEAQIPTLATVAGWTQVKQALLSGSYGDALKLRLGFQVGEETAALLSAEVIVEQTRSTDIAGATTTDRMSMSFADFHAWDTRVAVSPAAALANALRKSSLSLSREIAVPVDHGALESAIPGWLDALTGARDAKSKAAIQGSFKASLKGKLVLPEGLMASLAERGIAPPDGLGVPEALMAIGQALLSLRADGALTTPWLQAHEPELATAARRVHLDKPMLVGSCALGLEGTQEPTAGKDDAPATGGKVKAGVGGAITFDRPLDEAQVARLLCQAA